MEGKTVLAFDISDVPDPQDRMLAATCGGDVRGAASEAASQVLRALATLPPGQAACSLRFSFDPSRPRQSRLDIKVLLGCEEGSGMEAVLARLMEAGPLEPIFRPSLSEGTGGRAAQVDPHRFGAACEIVKRELLWSPTEERRELNRDLPQHYYLVAPFQALPNNDWSTLDRLLDRFRSPALVEIHLTPADVARERAVHYELVTSLMKANQTGWDLDADKARQAAEGVEVHDFKVRDPVADELLREHEDLQRALREPQLHFSVRCLAASAEDARLLASTVAESALGEGRYRLLLVEKEEEESWSRVLEGCINLRPTEGVEAPEIWLDPDLRPGMRMLKRLCRLASPAEIEGFFRLPVSRPGAPPRTARGRRDPEPLRKKDQRTNILIGDDLELGEVAPRRFAPGDGRALETMFMGPGAAFPELRLPTGLLRKHVFIAGVPGSGKTTAMFNILTQLAHLDNPVPFLVIEPAKTEYRTLKELKAHPDPEVSRLARELRVYTVGSEEGSPFRFNPLAYPADIGLDEHIGAMLSCFEAAMPMGGPLQGLLAEAVEEVYENPPDGRRFPRLKDLLRVARLIVDRKGYEGEVLGNLKAALDVRLGLLVRRSLGKVFDCEESVPSLEDLFESNVVLEMDYLTPEHACLMSLFVLSSLREHIRVTRSSGAPLAHVTVLEEAHNIVGKTGDAKASEEAADPKAFAAQYVSRMLAELRALGEGIIIADQLPSAVAPEVIKNTGTKLAHRLVANQDREELGGTMLLDEAGMEELARLQPGEAFFYTESTYRPRRCRGLPTHVYLAMGQPAGPAGPDSELPQPPGKARFAKLVGEEEWYVEGARERLRQAVQDARRAEAHLSGVCEGAEAALATFRRRMAGALTALDGSQAMKDLGEDLAEARTQLDDARTSALLQARPLWTSPDRARLGPEGFETTREAREQLAAGALPAATALLEEMKEEAGFAWRARQV